jgi:2-haloacid dehalogenase
VSDLPLIVFDVNETLLDLETMNPVFERIFNDKGAMRLWFANLILYSEALTLARSYVPFTDIGGAVLRMLAKTRSMQITAADEKELKERFSTMPPHPEVPGALAKLRSADFRLFTLTDNLLEVQGRQLESGRIIQHFERRFSVDQVVRRHKPAPEAYAYVERELDVPASRMFLIASHTWDTLGAVAAGWGAALIKRTGNDVLEVGPQPTFVGSDLNAIADLLIGRFRTGAGGLDG